MPEMGGRLNLPDPHREMMVCYSGAENQSLPVRKKVQLGDSSPDCRSSPFCVSRLKLHESFGCSIQQAMVRMNEFERFVVFYGYLLVTARMAQSQHTKFGRGPPIPGGPVEIR